MTYYRKCPDCGAYLDPDERCDCQDKETALSATNAESGKVDHEFPDPRSICILRNYLEEIKSGYER